MSMEYKVEALTRMTTGLRNSAKDLANSTSNAPPAPDAGDSSAILAKVISDLLRSGAAIAAKQESIAGKIHAGQGSYDEVENNNEGRMKMQTRSISESGLK